jgi:UDP-2,3-diacylglucosamine pyrophosphatase LpxH
MPLSEPEPEPTVYRTLFLSDIHLGTRGCQAELLLDFLRHNDAETIYLVGDIVDGWRLRSGWYWPQAHNDVIQKLLRKVRKGARMIYVPGNHDEFARDYIGMVFGGVEVTDHAYHMTADKKRLLIVHGDQFDIVVQHARWLAWLGDWAYTLALWLNLGFNKIRRRLGFPYWSFSAWAKLKVKNAVNFIGAFETALAEAARRHHANGVVCGHIHHAVIRDMDGITYINTGDFVESCTAVAEHQDGRLEVLWWQMTAEEQRAAVETNDKKTRPAARAAA